MKTSRKITLGFSYLLSACADLSISSPSAGANLRRYVFELRSMFASNPYLLQLDLCPKCYNIRRKK